MSIAHPTEKNALFLNGDEGRVHLSGEKPKRINKNLDDFMR
jgi:hypothetical protein